MSPHVRFWSSVALALCWWGSLLTAIAGGGIAWGGFALTNVLVVLGVYLITTAHLE